MMTENSRSLTSASALAGARRRHDVHVLPFQRLRERPEDGGLVVNNQERQGGGRRIHGEARAGVA